VNQIVSYEDEGELQFLQFLFCVYLLKEVIGKVFLDSIYIAIYYDIYHGIFYKKKEGVLYDDCKGF